jgi:periplasmic protein TorT
MKHLTILAATAIGICAMLQTNAASATDAWWPVRILDAGSDPVRVIEYSPPANATKPWKICVLFPHMKDSFWVAVDYGVVSEARRLGVNLTVYEAGGYENLPKQISQFDDCLASGFDAIVVGAISENGLAQQFKKAIAAGKPVISTVNPVTKADVTAKMFVAFEAQGEKTGKYLVEYLNGKEAKVGAFPGPAGSGWAEASVDGFKDTIKGVNNITLLTEKYGDSGVAVQLGLVQNALQAYPEMNVIWGGATTAEAAIGAVKEAGRSENMLIMSSYENQAMLDDLKEGKILGFVTQYPVLEGRIAIDQAVEVLEHKPYVKYAKPIPELIAKSNMDTTNMTLILAPAGFKAEFSVRPQ